IARPVGGSFVDGGNKYDVGLERLCLKVGLVVGRGGLGEILMGFYRVKDGICGGKCVVSVRWMMGIFYLMRVLVGLGGGGLVGREGIRGGDGGGNMGGGVVAEGVGGDVLFGFVCG
ncbi:sodium:solute symporter family transporter, partial [Bacillus pumilus]|uniref:sodium:solute symporter family transporter n=1 Tax=Bacillus pumilus TaxID=1408 RepID=UPI003F68AD4F